MKRITSAVGFGLILLLGVTGCPEKDDEDDEPKKVTTDDKKDDKPAAAATTAEPTTPPPPAGPSVVERVKAEVDNKEGGTGTTVVVKGTKGAFLVPADWKRSDSGDNHLAIGKDEKSRFASTSFKQGESSQAKIDAAVAALGLAECQWGTPESVTLGKDKLPATVADGVCKRGEAVARTAYASVAGEDLNLVGVGSWDDPGGSDKAVFDVLRSTRKVVAGKDPGIAACCAALSQNMASAPLEQRGAYMLAISACQGAMSSPEGRAALGQVRAAMGAFGAPAACR